MITFTEDQIKTIKDNFERKGAAHQRDKLVEELSELLCEVCKHRVKKNRETQIIDEFADVLVVFKGFDMGLINARYIPEYDKIKECIDNVLQCLCGIENSYISPFFTSQYELAKISNFSIFRNNIEAVQKSVDFKVARLAKKQNYQVEPYELIK